MIRFMYWLLRSHAPSTRLARRVRSQPRCRRFLKMRPFRWFKMRPPDPFITAKPATGVEPGATSVTG